MRIPALSLTPALSVFSRRQSEHALKKKIILTIVKTVGKLYQDFCNRCQNEEEKSGSILNTAKIAADL